MSSIVTTIGTNKLANATPLDQLEIIQIAVGDGNGSTPTLNPSQNQLVNEVWRGGVSTPIKGPQENIVIFEGFIPQNIGPFTIREVGIFDSAGDLIAVGTTAIVEKPDPATETAITLRIRLHVALESTSDIQLIAQDQGVFDHQGATNRDAEGAHPASSITTAELTALALSASEVQGVLNNLKNAALRAMGTATNEVPDNAQLNTRLGTTGNLGTAATRNVGYNTDEIVDKEILDSRFGGYTGNLNTAARFPVGSEPLSIPNNEELNTRLSTTGNLGDAAQKTIGTGSDQVPTNNSLGTAAQQDIGSGTDQVPDKEILDSRFGEGDNVMVGAVVYFATTVTPSGYIKANGAAVSRTTYANLFARVGTFWGTGNGSTTFNVPDLRGEFIRTFDDGRGIDSGRSFGSFQAEEFKSHTHPQRGSVVATGSFTGYQMDLDNTNATVAMNISTDAAGGDETRPRNIALAAYIKY
jgi:phage-related tail fiber protein